MIAIETTNKPVEDGAAYVARCLADTQTPVLLLFSSESPAALFDTLTVPSDASHVTVSVLDERCDLGDYETLHKSQMAVQLREAGATHIELSCGDDPAASATQFGNALEEWRNANQNGRIIAVMGVGQDGHIAGILPGYANEQPFTEELVTYYEAMPEISTATTRITTTTKFLLDSVDIAVVYITGLEKHEIVEHIVDPEDQSSLHVPVRLLYKMKDVMIFTDVDFTQEVN